VVSFDIGTRNLGVAASGVAPDGDATLLWLDTADISASSSDRCVTKLWEYLDGLMEQLAATSVTVLIEAQPSKARSLMRSVELAVRHYFLMRSHQKKTRVDVRSVSPRTKLGAAVQYGSGASVAQKYKARKDAAVKEVTGLLSALPEAARFVSTGKGDDAADALLYHVRHGGAKRYVAMHADALRLVKGKEAERSARMEAAQQRKESLKEAARQRKESLKEAAAKARAAARAQANLAKADEKANEKAAKEAAKAAQKAAKDAAKAAQKAEKSAQKAAKAAQKATNVEHVVVMGKIAVLPCILNTSERHGSCQV